MNTSRKKQNYLPVSSTGCLQSHAEWKQSLFVDSLVHYN